MPATGIEEIIVTAQRRPESLQRSAIAITALSGERMREAGVSRPQDLTHLVPALQSASITAPYSTFYIRGVGNFAATALADAAVAFNFNEVYIGRPSSTSGFFYDLERLEVLKGPQGTLYGRNATGGAINVIPRGAELGKQEGELVSDIGNEGSLRADGVLNLPLSGRAAMRLAGSRVQHNGYMNDGMDDQDDLAGRLSLRLEPSDDLRIRLVADVFDQDGRGPGSTPIALGPENRFGVSSAEGGAFYASQRVSIAGRNFNPIPGTQQLDNRFWGLAATIDTDTRLGTLTILPAYRESRLEVVGSATGVSLSNFEDDRQTSLELRLASAPEQRLRYVAGAYYFDETNDSAPIVPNPQYNMSVQQPHTGVESGALFGQASWAFDDKTRATLGARYTSEEKFFRGSFESFNRLCPPVPVAQCPDATRFPIEQLTPPLGFPPGASTAIPVFDPVERTLTVGFRIVADETESFSETTWRAALEHELSEQSFLFASYETGFKSGGFFFSNDSQVFRPEHLDAITLGSRNRFLDNRLQLDIEAFHWRYDDQQVSFITLDSRGVQNLRTQNIGKATIEGAEIEARWLVLPQTQLGAHAQYLEARYDDFAYLRPFGAGPPITGCAVSPATGGVEVDCSGERAPYAPEWTLNLSAEHGVPLDSGARLLATAHAHYQSTTLTGLDFTPLEYQDAYWSLDMALDFTTGDGRYRIGVFGSNLTDETVVANTFQPPLGSFVIGTLRPPRLYGLRLGVRF